jgi:hypothetical protein
MLEELDIVEPDGADEVPLYNRPIEAAGAKEKAHGADRLAG